MNKSKLSLLIILILAIATTSRSVPHKANRKSILEKASDLLSSAQSKISDSSVNSLGKTMASSVVGYYFSRVASGLSIAILNSMQSRTLANPKLLLLKGKTVSPPLLMIPPGAKDQSEAKISFLEEEPQGLLCYDSFTTSDDLKLVCIYFRVSGKEMPQHAVTTAAYNLDILNEATVAAQLNTLTTNRNIGENSVTERNDLQIITISQMTTGENARLFLEVKDSFPAIQSAVLKRELVSAMASGLAGGVATSLISAASNYFAKKYGTILTLENLSSAGDPFTLYDPIW